MASPSAAPGGRARPGGGRDNGRDDGRGLKAVADPRGHPRRQERGKAFGAVAGGGAGLGLIIGGALTSALPWRRWMYVNLVFTAIAFLGGVLQLGRQPRTPGARLDVPGAVAVSGGMFCLVYGFATAATHNLTTPSTWGFLAAVACC